MTLRVFDRFEIIRKLSSGGYGDIFLARQVGLLGFERLAVLKSLKPEIVEDDRAVSQFLNEARTAARLNHPNVVAIYEVDEWRGVYFIAMEYIDGVDLADVQRAVFRHEQRIPFRVATSIVAQAALGLDHAHRATDDRGRLLGIVHLDVSPQNIMVRRDGIAKVVDFGVAASVLFVNPDAKDVLQGKLRYMSPEQLQGDTVDGKSDQFSLGIVLWELCVGQRMFAHSDPVTTYEQITAGVFPKASSYVRDIPADLEAVLTKMMAYRVDQRFASCREAAAALDDVFDDGAAREPLVERFVQALLGKKIRDRVADLEPKPVRIAGLLDSATRACTACHHGNPLASRFCGSCGAPLEPGAKRKRVAPKSDAGRRIEGSATGSRSLGAQAVILATMFAAERRRGVVVAYRALGKDRARRDAEPAAFRGLERALLRSWTDVSNRYGATILASTEDGGQLLFSSGAATEILDAVRCGLELVTEVERTFAAGSSTASGWEAGANPRAVSGSRVSAAVVLAAGEVEVEKRPRLSMRGAPVEEAAALLETVVSAARSGVFLADSSAKTAPGIDLVRVDVGTTRTFAVRGIIEAAPEVLIGRRAEMLQVSEVLAQVETGTVASILFAGDPGSGKTSVLREAERAALSRNLGTMWLDGRSAARRPSIAIAVDLLRSGLEKIQIRPDNLELIGVEGPDSKVLEALLGGEPLEAVPRNHLATVARALRKVIKSAPSIVLADDLHLAPGLARFLVLLLEGFAKGKIGVIATCDAADRSSGPWRTIELGALSDDKMLSIAAARLRGQASPVTTQILLERSRGNPSALCFLIDSLRDRGDVPAGDVPDRIDGLVRLRLFGLSDRAKKLLYFGAVYGPEFPIAIAARAGGLEGAGEIVEECLSCRLVEKVGDHLRFVQPAIASAVAASIVDRDTVEIHRQLAQALAALAAPGDPIAACRIAEHAVRGRGGLSAAKATHRALVMTGNDPSLADLAEAASIIVAERSDRLDEKDRRIAFELGARSIVCVERIDLEKAAVVANPILDRIGPDPSILLERGRAHRKLNRLREAEADLIAVLESSAELRCRGLAELAKVLEARGALEEAATALAEALEIGELSRWEMLNDLGRLYLRMSRIAEADSFFTDALHDSDASGRPSILTNRAFVLLERKDQTGALALLDEAKAGADELGDDLGRARIDYNRGRVLASLGRRDEGVAALEEAADIARSIRWTEGEALALEALREMRNR